MQKIYLTQQKNESERVCISNLNNYITLRRGKQTISRNLPNKFLPPFSFRFIVLSLSVPRRFANSPLAVTEKKGGYAYDAWLHV